MNYLPYLSLVLPNSVHGRALAIYIIGALLVGAAALFALMCVPPRYRKIIVVAVTFFGGLYFSLEFLLPHQPIAGVPGSAGVARFANSLTKAKPNVADWAMIIGSFTLLLGTSNLFAVHGRAVKKKTEGWYNSLAFFITFFLIMIFGFLKDSAISSLGPGMAKGVQSVATSVYSILFDGFVQNLDATMFSLIAFYIVSAAYRAFRVRSAEAGLMMGTAAIIMLGLVPIGAWLTDWLPSAGPLASLRLENITYWLLTWPNMAVQRAIEFGLAVGAVAMSLRIWLSLERGSFFDRQL